MISRPYDHQHPLFRDQPDYVLERAVLDTGDASHETTAVLTFRHPPSDRVRSFRFTGVAFTPGCGAVMNLRGYLPVYVATLARRCWEGNSRIEVGDTDPGGVWFWAEAIEETT